MKVIADKWHDLNIEQKLLLQNKSKLLLQNYCLQYENYKKSLTIEQQDIIKQLKINAQKEKHLLKTRRVKL
jgi:phage terminase small subunit